MATVEACPSAVFVGYGIKATGFGFASDAQAVRIKDARHAWRASDSCDADLTRHQTNLNAIAS